MRILILYIKIILYIITAYSIKYIKNLKIFLMLF